MSNTSVPRRAGSLAIALASIALVWAAWDLYGTQSHDLRDFQPDEVARLETAMWRSYYDRARVQLFRQLATLLREQDHLPLLRSYVVAYHAARAAAVFQDGRNRSGYERALPHLAGFYGAIDRASGRHFDVPRTARLELEWWIVHRERASHPPNDLEQGLADLQAGIYHVPVDRVAQHAKLRADAMLLRDSAAKTGKPSEQDWSEINRVLRGSWQDLWQTVNAHC